MSEQAQDHNDRGPFMEPVAEMYLRMMNWNGRGRPDDPPPTPFVDVRWFNRDLPAGTKLYTAPPVADAKGVTGERVKPWEVRLLENGNMGNESYFKDQEIAELRAALSRRPAAVAEELAPQDVSVLRRWAEQIERMASVFNDERSLLCQQAAILLHRIAYRPAEVAAEQPAAQGVEAPIPTSEVFAYAARKVEDELRQAREIMGVEAQKGGAA